MRECVCVYCMYKYAYFCLYIYIYIYIYVCVCVCGSIPGLFIPKVQKWYLIFLRLTLHYKVHIKGKVEQS